MRRSWLLVLFFLSPTIGHAQASFDCSLAATPTEHAICAHDDLSQLDRQVAGAYRDARSAASPARRDAILKEQRAWLERRDACGPDRDCLARLMRERIAAVSVPTPAQGAGLTGLYCKEDSVMSLEEHGTSLRFDFMFFSAGHACGAGPLTAQRSGAGWTSISDGCRLNLTQEGAEMVVRSGTVDVCKSLYCGARAAIVEFRMPLTGKVPGVSQPFGDSIGEWDC